MKGLALSLLNAFVALFLPLTIADPTITYAALGDSYAAGDGAGDPVSLLCTRFSEAYPVQVAKKFPLSLRYLACGGAFIDIVLWTQVPFIGDSDVISIQVGGNEADFFLLLNECVHQWYPLFTCATEVTRAHRLIQSSSFIEKFDRLISRTMKRKKEDALLLVLGYARFFNEKTTQCDHVTFSKKDPQNVLTREKRKMFNDIISMVNVVVKAAAEAHGATYVDIDQVFEGHRFCEEGVIEPASNSSWFFNDLGGVVQPLEVENAKFPGLGGFINLTRVFHPTIQGHAAIADEIVRLLDDQT